MLSHLASGRVSFHSIVLCPPPHPDLSLLASYRDGWDLVALPPLPETPASHQIAVDAGRVLPKPFLLLAVPALMGKRGGFCSIFLPSSLS